MAKIRYGKILAVVILTVLIWVWADLAKTEEFSLSGAVITVAKSANPDLWVSFNDEPSVSIDSIVFKGPASKVDAATRQKNDGSLNLEFFLDPAQEGINTPGIHTLTLLSFFQKDPEIKKLGLKVDSCVPETIDVQVIRLDKKKLTVKCFDQDQNLITDAAIDPPQIEMAVPESWLGDALVANVQLTPREIEQARTNPVDVKPYIELVPGQRKEASIKVRVTTPPEKDPRSDYLITATLSVAMSPTMKQNYDYKITNFTTVMQAITIKATLEAKDAYEQQPFPPMTLYILDSDPGSEQRRPVVYNFPEEYVRKDEIVLIGQSVEAQFELTPKTEQTE